VPKDSLTGLESGLHFEQQLDSMLFRAGAAGEAIAIALLDVEGLKEVNRRFGWAAGDAALLQFGTLMKGLATDGERLWHIGGDAFVAALRRSDQRRVEDFVEGLAARLAESESAPLLSFHCGLATFPEDGATARRLMRVADRRLAEARKG
jgi:diguanylate cyclase (GGDEF)-like protein